MPWPWCYMVLSIVPLMRCSCTVPLAEKTPPKHNVSTSMFDGGDGVLGVIGSIPPPPNTPSWVDAKELDFCLICFIWPQHFHPVLLWIIDTLQTGCSCAFLSRGILLTLQDFSPSWRSVLLIVFLVIMVSAALRSLTRSSRVVPPPPHCISIYIYIYIYICMYTQWRKTIIWYVYVCFCVCVCALYSQHLWTASNKMYFQF